MSKMVTVLLMAIVVVSTFLHADALDDGVDCYECAGYNSRVPDHRLYNNKYCPPENFDPSKIDTIKAGGCSAVLTEFGRLTYTQRTFTYPTRTASNASYTNAVPTIPLDWTTRLNNTIMIFQGYYCQTAFCNKKNPRVTSSSSFSTLSLHLQSVLLFLLLALPRCMT